MLQFVTTKWAQMLGIVLSHAQSQRTAVRSSAILRRKMRIRHGGRFRMAQRPSNAVLYFEASYLAAKRNCKDHIDNGAGIPAAFKRVT